MQAGGREVDLRGVAQGFDDAAIAHAGALTDFVDAVVEGDARRIAAARARLRAAIGEAGLVDAAAIVGAFHGFVRVADAIGIPYTTAVRGADAPELRERAGVNAFYRVRGEG
jgi:hypothetical protein